MARLVTMRKWEILAIASSGGPLGGSPCFRGVDVLEKVYGFGFRAKLCHFCVCLLPSELRLRPDSRCPTLFPHLRRLLLSSFWMWTE